MNVKECVGDCICVCVLGIVSPRWLVTSHVQLAGWRYARTALSWIQWRPTCLANRAWDERLRDNGKINPALLSYVDRHLTTRPSLYAIVSRLCYTCETLTHLGISSDRQQREIRSALTSLESLYTKILHRPYRVFGQRITSHSLCRRFPSLKPTCKMDTLQGRRKIRSLTYCWYCSKTKIESVLERPDWVFIDNIENRVILQKQLFPNSDR